MIAAVITLAVLLAGALAALAAVLASRRRAPAGSVEGTAFGAAWGSLARVRAQPADRAEAPRLRRVLFPFTARALSPGALDAALRLAGAERATLVPVFLARVALRLPLDAPLPRQSALALPLQEAIEQRAARFSVPVDHRIERGRSYRHALRQTFRHERFDRIVMTAAPAGRPGFGAEDVAWLLEHAPGEIVVLRPEHDGAAGPTPAG